MGALPPHGPPPVASAVWGPGSIHSSSISLTRGEDSVLGPTLGVAHALMGLQGLEVESARVGVRVGGGGRCPGAQLPVTASALSLTGPALPSGVHSCQASAAQLSGSPCPQEPVTCRRRRGRGCWPLWVRWQVSLCSRQHCGFQGPPLSCPSVLVLPPFQAALLTASVRLPDAASAS